MRVGSAQAIPYTSVTPGGSLRGFVPDHVKAFVEDTGIAKTIQAVPMSFDSIIPSITTGKVDMSSDTMYATAERRESVLFTEPISNYSEALIVKEGNPKSLGALEAFTPKDSLGTYQGTAWVDWIQEVGDKQGAKTKIFPSSDLLIEGIVARQVDAGLMSSTIVEFQRRENPQIGVELASAYEPRDVADDSLKDHLPIAKSCPDLKKEFDAWYAGYVESGNASKTFEKWGLTPDIMLDGIAGYAK